MNNQNTMNENKEQTYTIAKAMRLRHNSNPFNR